MTPRSGLSSEEQQLDCFAQFALAGAQQAYEDAHLAQVDASRVGGVLATAICGTQTLDKEFVKVTDRGSHPVRAEGVSPHLYTAALGDSAALAIDAGVLLGVTIYNDFSARDIQRKGSSGGLGPAKAKDFATGLGSWITTTDELDVHNLTMVARVNGEEWSRGSSSSLMWSVEELIAYVSKAEGVHTGELIGSGTVGFGCGLELGRKLQPGDIVELEISGIGILRNRIGSPRKSSWKPSRCTSASS